MALKVRRSLLALKGVRNKAAVSQCPMSWEVRALWVSEAAIRR